MRLQPGSETPGVRVHDPDKKPYDLQDGEYMKSSVEGEWWIRPPGGVFGTINNKVHTIVEHEDGTITVTPSILYHPDPEGNHGWHGYLTKGVWSLSR